MKEQMKRRMVYHFHLSGDFEVDFCVDINARNQSLYEDAEETAEETAVYERIQMAKVGKGGLDDAENNKAVNVKSAVVEH